MSASSTPSLDPVAVAGAIFAGWLGPALAHVIGAYFVIIISAAAGSGWALMRRPRKGTTNALLFVLLMMTTSTLTTVGVAQVTNRFLNLTQATENFLLPTVALLISGIGQDWVRVVPWLADTIVQLIITLKGGGNGSHLNSNQRPNRDYRARSPRAADDERTGAIRDD